MNQNKTATILQRVPKILAVTAASYGLSQQHATRCSVRPQAKVTNPEELSERPARHREPHPMIQ